MSEPKKYSLKLKTVPLVIEDEMGNEHAYTLKELTGSQRDDFLSKQAARATDAKGKEKRPDVKGACSDLLVMSLYDEAGRAVDKKTIDNWPSEMQMDLFLQAVTLSGLDKKGEEEAKNA